MKYSLILSIAVLALSSGCAATTDLSGRMAGWQGQDVTQAIDAWGQPDAQEAFGEQTVLIWQDRGWSLLPEGAVARSDSAAVICERLLAVTDDGEVTGWRWRGDACLSLHAEPVATRTMLSFAEHGERGL